MQRTLATWIQRVQSSHLWQNAGRPVKQSPVAQSGVSVEYLRLLLESLGDLLAGADTAVFVSKAILPLTQKKRSRVYDFIPAAFTGRPDYYVVHAWQGSFHDLINQIVNQAQEHGSPLRDIYVWLDIVALDQHPSVTAIPDLTQVRELVTVCTSGALVVMDTKLELLNRAWCLFEIWCFLYYKDLMNISVCISGDLTADMLVHYLTSTQTLDLTRAKTSRPQDLARIISEVKGSCGIKLFHKPLRDGLSLAMRHRLRFSSDINESAIYCLALLKMGEYGHLQQVLSDIPRLNEDCNTLDDIKAIYEVYDVDGSGTLDEDEFIEVLRASGFSTKESKEIFNEVNIDRDDTVSLQEFEMWWINVHMAPGVITLSPATLKKDILKIKLIKMLDYAIELELDDTFIQQFKQCVQDMKDGKLLGEQYPEDLAPNSLRGEWENIAELCLLKINNSAIKSSMKTMYDLFKLNQDQLVVNINKIPSPRELADDPMKMAKMLPTYLQVVIYLISLEWGLRSQNISRYLQETIDQLKKPGAIAALGALLNMIAADGGQINQKGTVAAASYNYQTIIKNMVALKYGASTPVSKQLITEAEKALGQFRAATKKGEPFSGTRDYLGKCGVSTCPALTVEAKAYSVRREIPAEGHYRSLLADLGPDAHAYLEEIADEHEGGFEHSQQYLDELLDKKTECKLLRVRSKQVFVQAAPSFSNPTPGTFEKARETISRSGLATPSLLLQRKDSGEEIQKTNRYGFMGAPCRDGSLPASAFADPDIDSLSLRMDESCRHSERVKSPCNGSSSAPGLPAATSLESTLASQVPRAPTPSSRRYSTSVVTASALNHLATSAEGSVQQFTAGLKTIIPGLPPQGSSSTACCPPSVLSSRQNRRTWTNGADSSGRRGSSSSEMYQIELPKKEVSYSIAAPRQEKSSPLWRPSDKETSGGTVRRRTSYNGLEPSSYTSTLRPTTVDVASRASRRPSLHVDVWNKSSHSIFDSPSAASPRQVQSRTTLTGLPSNFSNPVGRPTVPGLNLQVIRLNSEGQMLKGMESSLGSLRANQPLASQRTASLSAELPIPPMQDSPVVNSPRTRKRYNSVCVL